MNKPNHTSQTNHIMRPMVKIMRLPHGTDLPLPSYETKGSAGLDLRAACQDNINLSPQNSTLIPTGFAMALPPSYEAQIRPRSGLAAKYGITLLNTPGTIDSDYRGEIKIILINLGSEDVLIERGDRIAQMIIAPCCQAQLLQTQTLDDTQRGTGGFGSTGKL